MHNLLCRNARACGEMYSQVWNVRFDVAMIALCNRRYSMECSMISLPYPYPQNVLILISSNCHYSFDEPTMSPIGQKINNSYESEPPSSGNSNGVSAGNRYTQSQSIRSNIQRNDNFPRSCISRPLTRSQWDITSWTVRPNWDCCLA